MKIKEIKHNHSLTELLKICIFAILMIAPLFASISQMLYVTVNKNAYQSYTSTTITAVSKISSNTQTAEGLTYTVKPLFSSHSTSNKIAFSYFYALNFTPNVNAVKFDIYSNQTGAYLLRFFDNTDTEISGTRVTWGNPNESLNGFNEFQFTLNQSGVANLFNYANVYYTQYKIDTLDNAFYYGVNKMTESSLFNWTQNTAIYTPINTMTTQLGITTPAIAILITYWFILIVIYIVLDIVLKCFTMISHLIFRSS